MPFLEPEPGRRLFYSEEGSGDPVLLIHGWACDGTDWSWLTADLSRDHRVVVIDNRGHGRSDPGEEPVTPTLFAADAARVIEELGLGRPVVVGHSMGTIIASTLAVERPELVAALVLIDPVYGVEDTVMAPALAGIRQVPHLFTTAAFAQFYGPNTPEWLPVWHRRRILATAPEVVRDSLVGLYEGEEGIGRKVVGEHYLRRRSAPILAVYAGSGAATAEWDRTLDHGPDDEIVVWAEHGHFLHQEAPDRFAAEVRRWLAALPAAPAAAAV